MKRRRTTRTNDESLANPYPDLPDPLVLANGSRVATAAEWWKVRRPRIAEDLEREMYGRIPRGVPKVTWQVVLTDHEFVGRTLVIAKRLIGHVENAGYPAISVEIEATEFVPANAKGPVPMLVMFSRSVLPAPRQPRPEELDHVNAAMRALLAQQDPDLARAGEYARLLASVGINGCNVNNVNADLETLSTEHLREFARIAEAFRPCFHDRSMHPGDAPGLGVEIDEALAAKHPYQRAYLPVARLLDGTLTDW